MSFIREDFLTESPMVALAYATMLLGKYGRVRKAAVDIDPIRKEIAEHNAAVAARKAEKLARRKERA